MYIEKIIETASYNPQEYNGYKVCWNDGCQIIEPQASGVLNSVNAINSFDEIKLLTKLLFKKDF